MSDSENGSFIEFNGSKIWFDKIGSGPDPILLIPGPIGTGITDFQGLLEGEDSLDFNKFTVIAVEAPGWGRSRPPIRKYGANVYDNDCQCFHEVMRNLCYHKYSVIGFSEGSRVALLMAAKYSDSIHSIVLSEFSTYYSIKGLSALLSTKSVEKWHKNKIKSYLRAYKTSDEIQTLWNRFLKFTEFYTQYFPKDIFKDKYDLVRCPVLITHGDKDPIIGVEQPIELCERLLKARIHRFPFGEHDSHQKYEAQFSKIVQEHFLNPNDCITKKSEKYRAF